MQQVRIKASERFVETRGMLAGKESFGLFCQTNKIEHFFSCIAISPSTGMFPVNAISSGRILSSRRSNSIK